MKEAAVSRTQVATLGEDEDKKRRVSFPSSAAARTGPDAGGGGVGGASQPCCQAEDCAADLREAKRYHRRHKVCEAHFKAAVVAVAGLRQRFCQQCSRFHELAEFDDSKRSCRRRLAGHNERRRKSSTDTQPEGSNSYRQADLPGNPDFSSISRSDKNLITSFEARSLSSVMPWLPSPPSNISFLQDTSEDT
ncbi:hypothetical protein OPV22_028620 [Ensete ventricosum]|uniref:SBP-type domain-containing protein n=1 Tax=Ensete ventricosum TaxID=4639 RepID=A0AAV8Q8W7_ENSVE|nr:hypothetical protein OPV22_028620 [Ensete ventricosum]